MSGGRAALALLCASVPAGPACAQAVEATTFRPPLGRPLTYIVAEERDNGAGPQRYAVTRRVTFIARDGGYSAALETLRIEGDAKTGADHGFEQAAAALKGRTLTVLLDRDGGIVEVTGDEGVWERMIAALDGDIAKEAPRMPPARIAAARRLVAALGAAPVAQRKLLLASGLTPLIGSTVSRQGAVAPHAITQPARQPDGSTATLSGSESQRRGPDGSWQLERQVAGTTAAGVTIRSAIDQRTDGSSGLVVARTETIDTTIAGHSQRIVRSVRQLPVS